MLCYALQHRLQVLGPQRVDDVELALTLLDRAQSRSQIFRDFTEVELRELSENISTLSFGPGETIMQKGENATWVGILVDGDLDAVINGKVVGSLRAGDVCGEIALFQGGVRGASLLSTSPGAIAAIMVNDLEPLYRKLPDLCLKFVRMLGQAALVKFGNKNDPAPEALAWGTLSGEQLDTSLELFNRRLAADGFAEEEARTITARMQYKRFGKDELLMQRGEVPTYVGVLLSGRLAVQVPGMKLQQMAISPGELVGEVSYFRTGTGRNADVCGATPGILGGITHARLQQLGHAHPSPALRTLKVLVA